MSRRRPPRIERTSDVEAHSGRLQATAWPRGHCAVHFDSGWRRVGDAKREYGLELRAIGVRASSS